MRSGESQQRIARDRASAKLYCAMYISIAASVAVFCVQIAVPMTRNLRQSRTAALATSFVLSNKAASKWNGTKAGNSPGLTFVFYLGLEGTGHHMWRELIADSPLHRSLEASGLITIFSEQLVPRLYNKKNRSSALLSSVCEAGWQSRSVPNVTQLQKDVATTLRNMVEHVEGLDRNSTGEGLIFPVNMIQDKRMGTLSYPSHRVNNCRQMNYLNLDILYDTCDEAGVTCRHVYLHRDPHAVIRSTTILRRFNPDALHAIQLHTTMLSVLHEQLSEHSDRLAGCLDYDGAQRTVTNDIGNAVLDLSDVSLLGYPDPQAYLSALRTHFVARPPMTDDERLRVVAHDLDPYMKSMLRLHKSNIRLCERYVE